MFLGDKYVIPVNLKVIAYDGELIGMTIEMFDTETD
jgi:hypothetical protein